MIRKKKELNGSRRKRLQCKRENEKNGRLIRGVIERNDYEMQANRNRRTYKE